MLERQPLRVLSLGAGVQSTTLALMAANGEIPPLDAAIFADTQSEPQSVYDHLARLTAPGVLPFPVYIVSKGSLRREIQDACNDQPGAWARLPLFVLNPDGTHGMTNRQCTQDYKIDIIYKKVRELAGIKLRSPGPSHIAVEQVLGISLDEVERQRDGWFRWVRNIYPLIELGMNRLDCLKRLAAWGWAAPKSACTFCPYHDDRRWLEMKEHDPEAWADAVQVDRALRGNHGVHGFKGQAYLHQERRPLEEIDFAARLAVPKRKKQLRLYLGEPAFRNECAGVCGV